MQNKEFFIAVKSVCDDRNLEKDLVLQAIEKGICNAYKKEFGISNTKVEFNEENHEIKLFEYYVIVNEEELDPSDPSKVTISEAKKIKRGTYAVGDELNIERKLKAEEFGRIAASSCKQVFSQTLTSFERNKSTTYFKEKIDEMVDGIITKVDDYKVWFDLGHNCFTSVNKTELNGEDLRIGSKIKLYVLRVDETTKGPRVTVSRSDKNIIKRLFEEYIPEVKDGTIDVYGIARDPGERTKICVKTNDVNVEPVGACIGVSSERINGVLKALGTNEKIDIFAYSDDPIELVKNALQPADVFMVQINQKDKQALAVVPDDHFSLAIGKRGQNVRLAVQSCGWKIDIKSVSQAQEEGIDF